MTRRAKKAAALAAFSYLSLLGLGLGMLRAAQTTRRTLYGGQPVLAQVTKKAPAQQDTEPVREYTVLLGGGEWAFEVTLPQTGALSALAEAMPPCMAKYVLQLGILADRAADYTAECIMGTNGVPLSS